MPDTSNYGWTLPTPGGDSGLWGGILNTAFEAIDTDLAGVEDKADAALAAGGGAVVTLAGVNGAQDLDLSAARFFDITTTGITNATLRNCPPGAVRVLVQVQAGAALALVVFTADGGTIRVPGGSYGTITSPTQRHLFEFVTFDGGVNWLGRLLGSNFI
jgi:hypothetical protein